MWTASEFLRQYLTVLIIGVVGAGLVGLLLGASFLLRPERRQADKYKTYEGGVDPVGSMWTQSQIRYYVFALLSGGHAFVARHIGLVEMGVFVLILLLGLVYAWRKGVLKWV